MEGFNPVRQVEEKVLTALESLGFEKVRARSQFKAVKKIKPEFEAYFFSGVMKRGGKILIQPVVGMDFLPLRRALEIHESNPTTQVCHCYLGLLDSSNIWTTMELTKNALEDDGAEVIRDILLRFALPELVSLSFVEKIKSLFEDVVHHRSTSQFAVIQEHLKLEVLERLLSENSFGRFN
ncbi:hypothetical protein [Taklimakanibacter deserti]|uniref:hypothetical protein n=1 Tax=Taklimakanibacter deserti TaxID=2267839 RepID=UPI0013C4B3A9